MTKLFIAVPFQKFLSIVALVPHQCYVISFYSFFKMKLCIFLSFCVVFVSSAVLRVDPLVIINQGLVRGLRSSDGTYSSFLGIPYALVDPNNPFGVSKITNIYKYKLGTYGI